MQLFFIFDHMTFIHVPNMLLCTKFHENPMIFYWNMAIYRFSKWRPSAIFELFTTIRDHPRSLRCWPQLPVKFHINLIHRSEDIAIWIFRILGLKCLFRPQKWGFWGLWTPKCNYSLSRPPKSTSLCKFASFKPSTVKIRWSVWPVGELTESVTDTHMHRQTDTQTQVNLYSVHA